MDLFGWLKKKDQVPDWAKGLDNKQYRALWDTAIEWFASHGVELMLDEAEGVLVPKSGFMEGFRVSLFNLARGSSDLKPDEITAKVRSFLQGQWETIEETASVKSQSFDRVKGQMRVRLFANDPGMKEMGMTLKELNPEIVAVLCLDLSRSTVTVTVDELAAFGTDFETAFACALDQTLADFRSAVSDQLPLQPGRPYGFQRKESFFFSSGIHGLPDLYQTPPKLGIVVGVPTRSLLICHGIEGAISMKEVEAIGAAVVSAFQNEAGTVSAGLFWLFEGEILALSDEAVRERFSGLALKSG